MVFHNLSDHPRVIAFVLKSNDGGVGATYVLLKGEADMNANDDEHSIIVGVAGPSGSGKTLFVNNQGTVSKKP